MPSNKNRFFSRVYENCLGAVNRFRKDQGGNIAILFGITIIPAMIAVGGAVDYSRASQVKTAMQTALDSTALHLGLLSQDSSVSALEDEATRYFTANYQGDYNVDLAAILVAKNDQQIKLTLEASLPTLFLGLANIHQVDVGVVSEVQAGGGTIEIAMVLDNSGSMRGSKLRALKRAAENLVEDMFDSLPPGSTNLRFSLVPFATFVDIGEENANAAWMDTTAISPIHNENFDTPTNRFDLFDNIEDAEWEGCVEARLYPHDVRDTLPDSSTPETLYVPAFAPDTPDRGRDSKNDYLDDESRGSWIERQENVEKYAPDSEIDDDDGPSSMCEDQADLMPLTASESEILDSIDEMEADGLTNLVQGLVWGWRALSPTEPFTQGRAYGDGRNQKVLILFTDGQNYLSGNDGENRSRYSAYGFAKDNRLGTTSRRNSVLTAAMNDRTAEACNNIKNTEIILYTITFDVDDDDAEELMEECAESPDFYYDSPSASRLDEIFQEIASRLITLRLSQ